MASKFLDLPTPLLPMKIVHKLIFDAKIVGFMDQSILIFSPSAHPEMADFGT
jgi:hypothetical protein